MVTLKELFLALDFIILQHYIDVKSEGCKNFGIFDAYFFLKKIVFLNNSIVGRGGIWILDVSVGNIKKCQLSYKAPWLGEAYVRMIIFMLRTAAIAAGYISMKKVESGSLLRFYSQWEDWFQQGLLPRVTSMNFKIPSGFLWMENG